MRKIIISVFVLGISFGIFSYVTRLESNDLMGEITIELVSEDGSISVEVFDFDIEDTLFGILEDNYIVFCADSGYNKSDSCNSLLYGSRVILQIEDIETDWNNTFLAIYENDLKSNYGIDSLVLNDGDYFRFEYTEVGDIN
ncbi:MAG: DUF4430 domain-containing protein [Candidatus Izemoplasma sp.]